MSIFLLIIHVPQPSTKISGHEKKQLHTNLLHTLCELCTLQLIHVLSLNDLLSMKYQISVCFIPIVMLFHFSSALLFSVLISYLSQ